MDLDDLDPPRPSLEPQDLQMMSIDALKDYIKQLQYEINRAEEMIESKESHRCGAENLFNVG